MTIMKSVCAVLIAALVFFSPGVSDQVRAKTKPTPDSHEPARIDAMSAREFYNLAIDYEWEVDKAIRSKNRKDISRLGAILQPVYSKKTDEKMKLILARKPYNFPEDICFHAFATLFLAVDIAWTYAWLTESKPVPPEKIRGVKRYKKQILSCEHFLLENPSKHPDLIDAFQAMPKLPPNEKRKIRRGHRQLGML